MRKDVQDLINNADFANVEIVHSEDPITCALLERLEWVAIEVRGSWHGDTNKTYIHLVGPMKEFEEIRSVVEKKHGRV